MQQILAEPGTVDVWYHCSGCPSGCELVDHQIGAYSSKIHQHACHHFPSLTTAWVKVA